MKRSPTLTRSAVNALNAVLEGSASKLDSVLTVDGREVKVTVYRMRDNFVRLDVVEALPDGRFHPGEKPKNKGANNGKKEKADKK